jgi:hypothetical protein
MQTAAIRTVANSLPKDEAILITLLISDRYILFAELHNNFAILQIFFIEFFKLPYKNRCET